jgi:hypothetical protein
MSPEGVPLDGHAKTLTLSISCSLRRSSCCSNRSLSSWDSFMRLVPKLMETLPITLIMTPRAHSGKPPPMMTHPGLPLHSGPSPRSQGI